MWSSGQLSNILCHLENPSWRRPWAVGIPPFSIPPPTDTSKPPPPPPPPPIFPTMTKPPTKSEPLISSVPPPFPNVPPPSNQTCSIPPPPKNIPPPRFLLSQFPMLPPIFLPPYKCVPPPNRLPFNFREPPPLRPPLSTKYPPPVENQSMVEHKAQICSPGTQTSLCTTQSEVDRQTQMVEQLSVARIKQEKESFEACATVPSNKDTMSLIKTESFLEAESPLNLKVEKFEDAIYEDITSEDSCEIPDNMLKKEVDDFLLEDSFLKSSLDGVVSFQNIQLPMEESKKDAQAELQSNSLADTEGKFEESKAKEHERQRRKSKQSKLHRLFGRTESPPGRRKKSASRRSAIKCKTCRSGTEAKSNPRPLDDEEIATCSYVILDALVDECPLGHYLDPKIASINISTGFVTVYCSECHITIYMKNSMLRK